jgi:hypothetical protein
MRFVFARQIDSEMRWDEEEEGQEISVIKRSRYVVASLSDYWTQRLATFTWFSSRNPIRVYILWSSVHLYLIFEIEKKVDREQQQW